jgi:hypothetical protein
LVVAEPMLDRTRRNDSKPTVTTMRALTAMILIRIRPLDSSPPAPLGAAAAALSLLETLPFAA